MRILVICAGLLLSGCASSPFREPFRTAEVIPDRCDKDYCNTGKVVVWELYPEPLAVAVAQ